MATTTLLAPTGNVVVVPAVAEETKETPPTAPTAPPPTAPTAPPPTAPTPDPAYELKAVRSQLRAFESEILNLRADKTLLESDKQELQDALDKFKGTIRNSDETSEVLRTENQTLKLEVKGHLANKISMQKEINSLLGECTGLKKALTESKETEDRAKELSTEAQLKTKTLMDQHAQEIGRLRREHDERTQQMVQTHNKARHEMEGNFRQQKLELQDLVGELKESVTNQALRITSYERRLEMLDQENNRLRISQEVANRNKLSITQIQEIEEIKRKSEGQQEDIERLKHALSMFTINQHQDFRGHLT